MEPHPERRAAAPLAGPATTQEARRRLSALLLPSAPPGTELPSPADLASALTALASGTRRKVLIPLAGAPSELALVRRGEQVLVSWYDTGSAPEVHQLDRPAGLRPLLDACADSAREQAAGESDPMERQIASRLAERAEQTVVAPDASAGSRPVRRRGGTLDDPGDDVPLAFGFAARIQPGTVQSTEGSARADVHAMLFEGTLWAFVRGRRITLSRGPILLAAQRMVQAVRTLVDAWEAGRPANVRLRSGAFQVGVRLDRQGEVSLTLGSDGAGNVTAAALDVPGAALPILRIASDLVRVLVNVDRAQSRNLRVRSLRDEVRILRKTVRSRDRNDGFVNRDPDRLRISSPPEPAEAPAAAGPVAAPAPSGALRFGERWRFEIDGLDAGATFMCGDRLVLSTPRHTLAVSRDTGEVLWARDGNGGTALMAGTTLLRLAPDGEVELCDVDDGEPHARTRITPRVGRAPEGLLAGGGSIPPVAVLTEGARRLVAIDLRTGEPQWRFQGRGSEGFRLRRAGRVLLAVCGDGAVHAIDVASGEVVWRFSDGTRFVLPPMVSGETVVAASGEPGARSGTLYGLDLYSGRLRWKQPLDAAPVAAPVPAARLAAMSLGAGTEARLAAFEPHDGALRWMLPDPAPGAAAMAVDGALVLNAPGGRVSAVDLDCGTVRWSRRLSDPMADDVPRRLEPVLRGGALFLPAASVHVVRPSDGASLGDALPCDLIPDLLRVDERGWVYVGEESGHLGAYAPAPQLSVIRGGRS